MNEHGIKTLICRFLKQDQMVFTQSNITADNSETTQGINK